MPVNTTILTFIKKLQKLLLLDKVSYTQVMMRIGEDCDVGIPVKIKSFEGLEFDLHPYELKPKDFNINEVLFPPKILLNLIVLRQYISLEDNDDYSPEEYDYDESFIEKLFIDTKTLLVEYFNQPKVELNVLVCQEREKVCEEMIEHLGDNETCAIDHILTTQEKYDEFVKEFTFGEVSTERYVDDIGIVNLL